MITQLIVALYVAVFANILLRLKTETEAILDITLSKAFLLGAAASTAVAVDEEGNDTDKFIYSLQLCFGPVVFTLTYLK